MTPALLTSCRSKLYTQCPHMGDDFEKNPLLIPEGTARQRRSCPKCGSKNFTGRKIQGVVLFTCSAPTCKTEFGGSLPQEPIDPTVPRPPETDPPLVDYVRSRHPDAVAGIREIRRRPNPTQTFRTGALVPEDED